MFTVNLKDLAGASMAHDPKRLLGQWSGLNERRRGTAPLPGNDGNLDWIDASRWDAAKDEFARIINVCGALSNEEIDG